MATQTTVHDRSTDSATNTRANYSCPECNDRLIICGGSHFECRGCGLVVVEIGAGGC